ncbi:MAG: DUF4124 domain-containing protein [Gammaproteobacteria bacterium]|nr:DUF4124 domain-containing protein [Gammaproteobacteria bacterium]NIR23742.1 DUF4124 domain-containing protein [Gammaproteobacteria bacterium]NIS05156.1 DUF4124 domain-containing protein [Gammaproteobacteria bacterium]NIU40792.1 DUF4124 domain-containing protein [Gammaproteobacteria bacterium]NIV47681.1 DUF4124 domain-containing protein [Gammaproteobacteria bacterium]
MSRGKKRLPTVFFMMLLGGAATAGVYKWVDESGGVHYADEPPEQSGAQPVNALLTGSRTWELKR